VTAVRISGPFWSVFGFAKLRKRVLA